jgi:2-polyprenyl-3-methyl-5-hydroxy-6-metoxy-1,4-benzoquinol methylase
VTDPGEVGPGARSHYSYTHYADKTVAEGFDALRFGGPIGKYLLETQEGLLLASLAPFEGRRMLDVGTGTGRAAITLARQGAAVTGVDASAQMLSVARSRAAAAGFSIDFVPGDAHHLPFAERSFDAAVCLRVIMHTPDWGRCLAELCRVSRGRIVVDFPALPSAAALESGARRLALALGSRTEAYRVLSERRVRQALGRQGFPVVSVHRQFVLPIAFHKALGSIGFTRGLEGALAAVGLLRLFGSPVTLVAER